MYRGDQECNSNMVGLYNVMYGTLAVHCQPTVLTEHWFWKSSVICAKSRSNSHKNWYLNVLVKPGQIGSFFIPLLHLYDGCLLRYRKCMKLKYCTLLCICVEYGVQDYIARVIHSQSQLYCQHFTCTRHVRESKKRFPLSRGVHIKSAQAQKEKKSHQVGVWLAFTSCLKICLPVFQCHNWVHLDCRLDRSVVHLGGHSTCVTKTMEKQDFQTASVPFIQFVTIMLMNIVLGSTNV